MRRLLPTLPALGVLAVLGCAADTHAIVGAPPSPAITTVATPSTPAIPDSYRYVLMSSCGERGFLGRFRVVVREGVVAAVESLEDGYTYEPDPAEVPTLEGLVEMAESAEPEAVVDLVLDGSGLPRSLRIDHMPDAIDDEECYRVTALKTLE